MEIDQIPTVDLIAELIKRGAATIYKDRFTWNIAVPYRSGDNAAGNRSPGQVPGFK